MPRRLASLLLATAIGVPAAAQAEGAWSVLVIGNPSRSAPQAFADSFHASESLAPLGQVTLQRELGADAMATALAGLTGQPQVVLYFAGPVAEQSAGLVLMGTGGGDARAALDPLLVQLAAGGTTRVALLIEDCALPPGSGSGMAGKVRAPAVPQGLDLFMVASAGPDGACDAGAPRLTDLLQTGPGATVEERLAGLWTGSTPAAPFGLTLGAAAATPAPAAETLAVTLDTGAAPATDPAAAPAAAEVALADPPAPAPAGDSLLIDTDAPIVSLVSDEVIAISPVSAVTDRETVAPASLSASDLSVVDDQTVMFVAPAASQIAALPLAQGLPEPSIIIGLIAGTEASYDTVDDSPGDVSQNEITYDNLDARRALREQDPDLFKSLVEGGAFDPPDVDLAIALQTELSRMGCYTSRIDGDWGNGSKASVTRYFAELPGGQTPVTLDPTIDLFRQVIVQDEIECPAPVVAQQAAPRATSGGTQAAAPRAAAPAPRAAPAPAPAPSGGLNSSNALGTGVFR